MQLGPPVDAAMVSLAAVEIILRVVFSMRPTSVVPMLPATLSANRVVLAVVDPDISDIHRI